MGGFNDVISQALATVAGVAGEPVTYHRGDDTIADLVGVRGSSQSRAELINEVPIADDAVDWILEAAELVIDGNRITPQRGDQVRDAAGVIYEVGHDGDQVYRPVDRGKTRYRVHTKEAPPE